MNRIGEFAGLGAAFCWSFTALFFTAAGRRIGAFKVNVLRITLAVLFLSATLWLTAGSNPKLWFEGGRGWLLVWSGIIGLVIGDGALFRAFVLLGARRTTLMLSLVPIFTALIAWTLMGEALPLTGWLGILLTVGGVGWVAMEGGADGDRQEGTKLVWFGLALVASLCQAVGLILAKAGMGADMNPMAATLVRMAGAGVVLWMMALVSSVRRELRELFQQPRAMMLVLGGAVTGPFVGVWLSLVSVKLIEAGIAATLMATVPIWVIPWVWILHRERTSPRAILGTIAAVVGVAVLMNR